MRRVLPLMVGAVLVAAIGFQFNRASAADEKTPEAKQLFNGKDLTDWDGDKTIWRVEDGAITGETTADTKLEHNTFIIWRGGTVKNFELHLKYKISNFNSGVQYRSKDEGDHVVAGYQADIVGDTPDKYTGILYEERLRGILAQRGEDVTMTADGKKVVNGSVGDSDVILEAVKKGDWNEYTIIAKGNKLTHKINGETTIEFTDNQKDKAATEGILALQIHKGPPMKVQFKDIELIDLGD
jgi:hypothetical protein